MQKPVPKFILLYVDNPLASADFYAKLLDMQPVDSAPTFVMFALEGGLMLGLWQRGGVLPAAASVSNVAGELAFVVADAAAVDATHADWRARGATIAQAPADMDFGRTFVATDPDGHRLRVFAPGGP